MPDSKFKSRLAGLAVAVIAGGAFWGTSIALAADQGNWQGSCSAARGCFWRVAAGAAPVMASNTRDSNFVGDWYNNSGATPLNDYVKYYSNTFSSMNLRAYSAANYGGAFSCVPPGAIPGPYPWGVAGGISSFKSC